MLPPKRPPQLTPEDISDRRGGNCLLSFGFPGSGKTTFQSFMINYLRNKGPFQFEILVPERVNGPDWEGQAIVNGWLSKWETGRFPEPTPAQESDIREVSFKVTTTSGRKLSSEISFLEVSGELLEKVLPEPGYAPDLAQNLRAFLENPHLKFVLMLMINPDVTGNDQLFASLMSYLDHDFPGLRDRISIGIVLTKPQACLARLNEFSNSRQNFQRLDRDAQMAYLNRFCGQTYQIWSNWPSPRKTLLSPLYLGDIETVEGEPRLRDPDYRHIEQMFFWIVEQFTGQRPGPTWWQRLVGKMDWQ
ncbi:MAG: hypothetical protein F4213_21670 [Boseongicola sp. SB0677_bin_26]|nr:hypothetical protein [Boseongicola sp. SB0665_bin_10]MYG28590.1 hypothetical protein [Boseongicola sp. SB0677_bin_26]